MAARTIAERGVQLIGTAHGNTLENLMLNPTLSDLMGGIQSVTLSDEEARRRGTQKSILERKAPPTFNVMVEIVDRDEVIVHLDVAATVDAILRGAPIGSESRRRREDGTVQRTSSSDQRRNPRAPGEPPSHRPGLPVSDAGSSIHGGLWNEPVDISSRQPKPAPVATEPAAAATVARPDAAAGPTVPAFARGRGTRAKPLRVFPYGVSRNRLEQTILGLDVPAIMVREPGDADLVMTLKNAYRQKPQPVRDAELRGIPVYVLRSNTATQMEHVLTSLFPQARRDAAGEPAERVSSGRDKGARGDSVIRALTEAEDAISAIMDGAPATALSPQSPPIRRMQHELAERYSLDSRSRGRDPFRHVEIYRRGMQ